MAGVRNSGTDREAALRRVAIVLSSLPSSTTSALLGSIAPESKQALRRTMATLSDVDPLERQRALQAFKGSFVTQTTPTGATTGFREGALHHGSTERSRFSVDEVSVGQQERASSDPGSDSSPSPPTPMSDAGQPRARLSGRAKGNVVRPGKRPGTSIRLCIFERRSRRHARGYVARRTSANDRARVGFGRSGPGSAFTTASRLAAPIGSVESHRSTRRGFRAILPAISRLN